MQPYPWTRMTLPDEIESLLAKLPAEYRQEWKREDMAFVVRRMAHRLAERMGGELVQEGEEYAFIHTESMRRGEQHYRQALAVYQKAWEIAYTKLLEGWRDTLRLLLEPAANKGAA